MHAGLDELDLDGAWPWASMMGHFLGCIASHILAISISNQTHLAYFHSDGTTRSPNQYTVWESTYLFYCLLPGQDSVMKDLNFLWYQRKFLIIILLVTPHIHFGIWILASCTLLSSCHFAAQHSCPFIQEYRIYFTHCWAIYLYKLKEIFYTSSL